MTKEKPKKTVKCEGRFHELRDFLYNIAMPLAIEDRTHITEEGLKQVWDLANDELPQFDYRDSYYGSKVDHLRKEPPADYSSLVPLIESPEFHVEDSAVWQYCQKTGNSARLSYNLASMAQNPRAFMSELQREPRSIILPDGSNMSGYLISGNFGVGTLAQGGASGGGVRSDSPFLLEIYRKSGRGEIDLAALVGFWAQDDTMLVSQMQPCKNARLPENTPFGVTCLTVAEAAARAMGFKRIHIYSARGHPIFKEHPENWGQFGEEFVCEWDNSAKKLGYEGSRNEHYEKNLVGATNKH